MARDAVHITTPAVNAATANPTDGTVTQANGSVFTPASGSTLEEYLFRITHTSSGTPSVTIKGGTNPPADAKLDLVITETAGNTTPVVKWVGPLTSARFIQSDGTVLIDYASGFTGSIEAFRVLRTA